MNRLVCVLQHRFGLVELQLIESLPPFSLNQLEPLNDAALRFLHQRRLQLT